MTDHDFSITYSEKIEISNNDDDSLTTEEERIIDTKFDEYKKYVPDFNSHEKISLQPQLFISHRKHNIVYLFLNYAHSNDSVFKIGMTTRTVYDRLREYPKHSTIIKYRELQYIYCRSMEKILLYIFHVLFIPKINLGPEYFQGDINHMMRLFDTLVNMFDIPQFIRFKVNFPINHAGIYIHLDNIKTQFTYKL